jgi:class 3 adenylate cyclase
MLPGNVVEEIRNNVPLIAHEREEASVLFTDIVSFTTLASRIAPEHVVAILNVVFSTFDSLTTKYNVYKVETIGDAYLACSGIVDQHPKHTHD